MRGPGGGPPGPETGNPDLDAYVFERSARLTKGKGITVGKIDVFRAGCFIFEAKQAVNPGSKKAGDLPSPERGEEDEDSTTATATPWPKKLGARMTALRDLLLESSGAWTTARVVAAFDGAATDDVFDVLDGLASLGHVLRYKAEGEVRWQGVQAVP